MKVAHDRGTAARGAPRRCDPRRATPARPGEVGRAWSRGWGADASPESAGGGHGGPDVAAEKQRGRTAGLVENKSPGSVDREERGAAVGTGGSGRSDRSWPGRGEGRGSAMGAGEPRLERGEVVVAGLGRNDRLGWTELVG